MYFLDPILYETEKGRLFLYSKIDSSSNLEKERAIELLMKGKDNQIQNTLITIFKENNLGIDVSSKMGYVDKLEVVNLLNKELLKTEETDYNRIQGILQSILYKTNLKSVPFLHTFISSYGKDDSLKEKAKNIKNVIIKFNKSQKSKNDLYNEILIDKKSKMSASLYLQFLFYKVRVTNDKTTLPLLVEINRKNTKISNNQLRKLLILRYYLQDKNLTKEEHELIKPYKINIIKTRKIFKKATKEFFKQLKIEHTQRNINDF